MLKLWWSEHKMFKLVINWIFFLKRHVKQQVKSSQVHDKWKKLFFNMFWPCCWGLRHWKGQRKYFYDNIFLRILYLFDSIFQG